jgi:hypothetical protein
MPPGGQNGNFPTSYIIVKFEVTDKEKTGASIGQTVDLSMSKAKARRWVMGHSQISTVIHLNDFQK